MHRDLYADQSIRQDRDPGDFFDEHLERVGADRVWVAEHRSAAHGDRPLARRRTRNDGAIRFFHGLGFDSLGHIELMIYLQEPRDWPVQIRLVDRDFRA